MKMKISPCLWFDHQAEEAARFYTSIFKNSTITAIARYPAAGQEIHGKPAGSVMTVTFELNGQSFTALNGGPVFQFNEAVSLQIDCDAQEEVDFYWRRLSEGGDPRAQQCGWLKDKFGLSWQVVPKILTQLVNHPDKTKSQRAFQAMMQMKKLDIAGLQRAFAGNDDPVSRPPRQRQHGGAVRQTRLGAKPRRLQSRGGVRKPGRQR